MRRSRQWNQTRAATFAAEGKVRAHIHAALLEDVNRVLQDLKAGTIDGRIVLRLA